MEVVKDYDGDTYRTIYTVRFERAIYVLHAFQKKSPRGIETRQSDIALVRSRLRMAQQLSASISPRFPPCCITNSKAFPWSVSCVS